MRPSRHGLARELRPMLALAGPVVLAELGWIAMGIVDTLMVGRLGPEAIGAVGIGANTFTAVVVFGMGLLLGLDTLVSQAFGAQKIDECHRWLEHGVALAILLTVPITLVVWLLVWSLDYWRLDSRVLPLTRGYLSVVSWSVAPLLLFASFRRYLQATSVVRPVMFALMSANLVNALVNWILIFGKLGAPAMGVRGAAWATVAARAYMTLFLLGTIAYREWHTASWLPIRLERPRFRRLLALGFPAASQITLEVGVFATATALAGRLVPASLAAHQISLNLAAATFMVPYGVSSAGAVRVGQAVGRRDPIGVSNAGWTALALGVGFMVTAAAAFVGLPRLLLGAFTADQGVIDIGVRVLRVAAVFQIFDGVQGVATGILRGLGDTRSPMVWNLAGHWFLGLPVGYTLCFGLGYGVVGLWTGLSIGLIIVAIVLIRVWWRRIHALPGLISTESSARSIEPA
jgi:multidrug resistance protein, MATE family